MATSISRINPNQNQFYIRLCNKEAAKQSPYQQIANSTQTTVKNVSKFAKNMFTMLVGILGISVMGLGKTLAPDHTFFDKFSLAGIVVSTVPVIAGLVGLYRNEKELEKPQAPSVPKFTLPDDLSKAIHKTLTNISSFDLADPLSNKDILRNNHFALYRLLTNNASHPELKSIITCDKDREEVLFTNFNGPDGSMSLSQLREMMTGTLESIISLKPTDTYSKDILNTDLALEKLESDTCELAYFLPEEFVYLYQASRHYKLIHMDEENFINEFSKYKLENLVKQLESNDSKKKASVEKYLDIVAKSRNYLNVLERSVEKIVEIDDKRKENKASESEIRDAEILRRAIVSGLEITGKDSDERIEKLKEIFKTDISKRTGLGSKKGLKDKAIEIETYWKTIESGFGNLNIGLKQDKTGFPLFDSADLKSWVFPSL